MIVVPVKEGENIERALKKFKRKYEKTGIVKELRARQQFDKPSVINRKKKAKAIYVQKLHHVEDKSHNTNSASSRDALFDWRHGIFFGGVRKYC